VENRPSSFKLVVLVVVLLAAAGGGLWWLKIHDFNVRLAIEAGVAVLRDAGPFAFFAAMVVLPAFGCPISIFYLTAASAFAERLGMAGVLAAAGVAVFLNISLTYWLARYALRPWLEQMISRTKYKIPVVPADEGAEITLLLRITPGTPFFVQSYLLGLAGVSFRTYLWISWVVSIAFGAGFIVFGDAILHGKARLAIIGISVIVAVSLAVHLLRRHYGNKKT
jgi:uncharacterized membrane protein YdjX (TVP38/TMEM64 family)